MAVKKRRSSNKITSNKVRLIKLNLVFLEQNDDLLVDEKEQSTYLTIPYHKKFNKVMFEEFIARRTGNTEGVIDYSWEDLGESLHLDIKFDQEIGVKKKGGTF